MLKLKQKGQGLVEFALILLPLLMLILGIIEAARVFQAYLAVQHAAREAARYAVTGQPFNEFNPDDGPFTRSDAERAAAIKEVAKAQALGLTIDEDIWNLVKESTDEFYNYVEEPNFFGVEIHGFDTYDGPEKLNDPGQPGLPVRVRVVYNLVVLDPLYRAIIPQIRLVGHAEMVNEGLQVGYSGAPPPTFGPTPTLPGPPPPEHPPDTPTPTSTPEGAYIALNTYSAVAGQGIVIYLIQHNPNTTYDVVWIAPDSSETTIGIVTTDGDGNATLPYTVPDFNESGTYTVESRLGGSPVASVELQVQGPTPTATGTSIPPTATDTPTPTSTPEGPYIALPGGYYAMPGEDITIQLVQHQANTTYDVYWIPPDASPEIRIGPCTTNADGDGLLGYTVPITSGAGPYTIESRLDGAPIASVNLDVLTVTPTPTLYVPPDLVITDIVLGSPTAEPGVPVTITVQIRNGGGTTAELFDVDLYVDPEFEPLSGSPGLRKQWQNGLAAGATTTLVFDVTFYGSETTHQVWAQVDTTNYVDDESNEDNNIFGPVDVTTSPLVVCYLDDDMESGAPGWSAHEDYEDGSQVAPFALVEHGSGYYGSSSHSWWIDEASHHLRSWLDSPVVNIPAGTSNPQLIFWHRMRSEEDWDGGYLRYRIGSGSWTTVENDMIASGDYNSQVHNTWHTRPAWAGYVGPGQVVVNIPDAAIGSSIQFRWQWECDWGDAASNPNGWWIDDVAICTQSAPAEPPEQPKPPGMEECAQVIENGDFEAPSTDPWQYPLPPLETQRMGGGTWGSTFHMRLAALTYGPGWDPWRPYLYQDLTMPEFITTTSIATLDLYKKVCEPGSCPASPGQPDPFYVVLQTTGGVTLTHNITVATGMESGNYAAWSRDLFDPATRLGGFDPRDYAGSNLRLYFYAPNDGTADTWFFLDDLECDVCTVQPIPTPDPTKVTVGGLAQVLLGGAPRNMQGIDVYAYTAEGELFYTYTIQNSTYHFYWQLPPNETIYIYAETYIGPPYYRYWTQIQVPPMDPGEERHDVDLLLVQG